MDWSKGFSARYRAYLVDPISWRDGEEIPLIKGEIDRTGEDLMESAALTIGKKIEGVEQWIRVYLEARQSGDSSRVALFTGLTSAPERSIHGDRQDFEVDCYSVLKAADDILMQRGWYAPAGLPGANLIRDLLAVGPAPVSMEEDSPALTNAIVAEDEETNLSMAEKIADAIGWEIIISGHGEISIQPASDEIVATFDAESHDVVEMDVNDKQDWFACPNVFRAIMDDAAAVARDDLETSPLSTVSRGREVWMQEDDCDLHEGESLADYAIRRLREEQAPARTVGYTRRFDPAVRVNSLILFHYPSTEIDDTFRVSSQQITLGFGGRTKEEASYEYRA